MTPDPKKDREALPEHEPRERQQSTVEDMRREKRRRYADRDLRPDRARLGYETK